MLRGVGGMVGGSMTKTMKRATTTQPPARRMGRPVIERERTSKAGVVLLARHLGALDRLALDIRDASGKTITRSDILRGIVEGVLTSKLDLTQALSEAEIAEIIAARLRR